MTEKFKKYTYREPRIRIRIFVKIKMRLHNWFWPHSWCRYNYGAIYGEAGFSFHYDPEANTKYWGAPGSWNWTGTFVMQEFENAPVMTQPWSPQTPQTNDYAGYDITTGHRFHSKFKFHVRHSNYTKI